MPWACRPANAVRRRPGASVLLVTIDTLRADALGAYGSTAGATPWIDRLAAAGVRFERAHAQNVVTLPSHADILSGRYPLEHGVHDNGAFRFPRDVDTLATLLKARGYRTGAFVSAFPLDSRFGLDRGFDVYDDRFGGEPGAGALFFQERPGTATVAAARQFIDAGAEPFFCWVHLYEPHFPYEPPEPFASRFHDQPYLGEVAAADAALEPLLSPLLAAGAKGDVLVVLTADHGESLGEHGERTHGLFAYEATLHVPLLLFAPRILGPRVVAAPVRHVDLLPTTLDVLGLPAPAGLPGTSLLPVSSGGTPPPDESYFEALTGSLTRGWAPLRGVLQGRRKFIELPIPELYDLESDARELRNLLPDARADALRAALTRFRSGERGVRPEAESAETRERLASLGYLGGRGRLAAGSSEADDPKRLVELERSIEDAVRLQRVGAFREAADRCREILRRRPMPVVYMQLAALERRQGRFAQAVDAARKAVDLNPDDLESVSVLGRDLAEAGRAPEAIALLEPYARRPEPDLDVVIALGEALARAGRTDDALAAFDAVRRMDPSSTLALVDIATVHLGARRYAPARASLEAALAIDPRLAEPHNQLGVIAAETGHPDEAIAHWQQAVALDPQAWDTLYNLGALLRRRGRAAEARPFLERFAAGAPRPAYEADIARIRAWLR